MRCGTQAWDWIIDCFLWAPPPPTYEDDAPWLQRTPDGEAYGQWGAPSRGRPLLLWFHGNACDVGSNAAFLEGLAAAYGVTVVAPEYAGYGPGGGAPSLGQTLAACRAVYRHVAALPAARTVFVGNSIGTGLALELQRDEDARADGTILLAPFLSCLSVAGRPLAALAPGLDRLRSYEVVPRLRAPVLIVHGTADRVIPHDHGAELNELVPFACRQDLVSVDGGDHASPMRAWAAHGPTVLRFLARLGQK